MPVAISWKGFVNTNLQFSEFFAQSHTLVLRFMPQFPNAYEGPFVAENGTGAFAIGQGDFSGGTAGTKLLLVVGQQSQTFAATIKAGQWHHLAIVASNGATERSFTVYLNGNQLGSPVKVANNAAQMPSGTLRLGKRTDGQTIKGRNAQFYGLIDDVATFNKALTKAEVQALNTSLNLTGNESGLIAGWSFEEGNPPPKLARPLTYGGGAYRVTSSTNRDNAADAALLPLPSQQREMDLPFPAGEPWFVIQGQDQAAGSHKGYASFCWDFSIADQPQTGKYPKGSDGAPYYASTAGKVVNVNESAASGEPKPSNLVEIEQAPGEICAYLHLRKDTADVNVNDHVTREQKLALTGDTGASAGAYHLHLAASDKLDQTAGFVTFPVAFTDYEIRDANAKWKTVFRGMPKGGEVIRIPPTPTFRARSVQANNAVSRGPASLDVVAADTNGKVWSSRWAPNTFAHNWDRWHSVRDGVIPESVPLTLVTREPNKLDVFAVGTDQAVYTAARDENFANGRWSGWWKILNANVASSSGVAAVSRDANKLDVFIIAPDGGVWTAAWDQNVANAGWRGWWRIQNGVAASNSEVAAVSRDANKLDVFVIGPDCSVWTAAWDQNVASGQWRGWWKIQHGLASPNSAVTAISRDPNKLDVFVIAPDGGVWTAAWDQNVAKAEWRGWWRILDGTAATNSAVSVVSRDPNKLDVFIVAPDGSVWTAAWDQNVSNGQWRGWWRITDGVAAKGSGITAVSRDPNKLDVFIVGKDGGVWTAAWDQNVATGQWQGWWRIKS